jgi:hypothetical protein
MIETGTILWLTERMTLGSALAAEQIGAEFAATTVKIRDAELAASDVGPVAVSETATSEYGGVVAGGSRRTVAAVVSPVPSEIGESGTATI